MSKFAHDDIKPFSQDSSKTEQVRDMFDDIAGRYDFMNRFLSAGIDTSWRKKAIAAFRNDHPKILLDVATGTADMAIAAARSLHPDKVVGIDLSPKMLEIGREKVAQAGLQRIIELHTGDSQKIIFADGSFDGAMVAFGVRNFEDLEKGLSEILRVLKPGAKLVVLEFSTPRLPVIKQLYHLYMGVVAPRMARFFRQDKKAYEYLNESAKAFPDREKFISVLERVGFVSNTYRSLTMGICCIYEGRKKA